MVGGHATVDRLSNNVFWTFQAIWENFERSRWTVTRQWSEVTCDRRLTVKQRFLDVSSNLGKFWKKSLNGHATVVGSHSTVGRLSNNVLWDLSSNYKFFWKKSLNGHATVVGGHATVGRLSNNIFYTFQTIWENFEKSHWTVTRQWSGVTRPSADCQTTFFGRFKQLGVFWKKSLKGHATVVGGHATVGRLSNNVFWTFQAILENFEKNHWTVTRQWSEVTRPSADCQTAFFGRFKQFWKISKNVAERSRDSSRRSRDRRLTVKQRFWTFQAIWENFEKKSLNPTIFPFVDSCSISLGFSRESPAPQELCGASSLMFIMEEREREREREREGEREREKERERERERERRREYLYHIITMRWELHYIRVYPTIFSCVDPRYQLSRFFTGISRRNNGELISLIGNQRVGIFPPKSEILFVLSLALIWYRNFQDRTIPLGGDTWPCFWRKEGIIRIIIRIIRIKKYRVQGYVLPVEYLRNGKRYSSSVFTMAKANSHATKRCKRRLCRSYLFRDIIVVTTTNFECWPVWAL